MPIKIALNIRHSFEFNAVLSLYVIAGIIPHCPSTESFFGVKVTQKLSPVVPILTHMRRVTTH